MPQKACEGEFIHVMAFQRTIKMALHEGILLHILFRELLSVNYLLGICGPQPES